MIIWNGCCIEDEKIKLDGGYLYGMGVFETLLIKKGEPIFLLDHLDRLHRGLRVLNIQQSIELEEAQAQINKLNCEDGAVRISVSQENIIFSKRALTYKDEDYENGFSLAISEIERNPKSHMTYIKSFNYLDNAIERQRAIAAGYQEVLFLNPLGEVTEASTANLFFISKGQIFTPQVECGLLAGVLRKWILNNYPVQEGRFTVDDLVQSDGVFLTNSLIGIMKVRQIGTHKLLESPEIARIQKEYLKFLEAHTYE
ncbi:MAG: aminotransferase class IV [Vallitaleaceae bacterium]|nr:aminotransferase class IV [Vallitaleaceae bacterium]